jgi:hypothetical protein
MPSKTGVIVIGAGQSGLAAARDPFTTPACPVQVPRAGQTLPRHR